jgi:hypothetical protein
LGGIRQWMGFCRLKVASHTSGVAESFAHVEHPSLTISIVADAFGVCNRLVIDAKGLAHEVT